VSRQTSRQLSRARTRRAKASRSGVSPTVSPLSRRAEECLAVSLPKGRDSKTAPPLADSVGSKRDCLAKCLANCLELVLGVSLSHLPGTETAENSETAAWLLASAIDQALFDGFVFQALYLRLIQTDRIGGLADR